MKPIIDRRFLDPEQRGNLLVGSALAPEATRLRGAVLFDGLQEAKAFAGLLWQWAALANGYGGARHGCVLQLI
jgi:hypothetical protein